MLINGSLFAGVILIVIMEQGVCQVCTRNVFVPKTYREPYVHTYRERYHTSCWYGSCTKTRMRSVVDYKTTRKIVQEEVKECCSGYLREDADDHLDLDSDDIICKPICMFSCVNGVCSAPGECTCNPGYDNVGSESPHTCSPVCSESCDNGICIEPETCQCNFGYTLANKTCTPICTEPCVNGRCILPDTCACNEGYRKSENNNCEPYCSKGCTNGFCRSPETCQCIEGYTKDSIDESSCYPACKQDCGNGTCISPDKCACDPGFELKHESCEPACIDCLNGECVAPDLCECNPGYELLNNSCGPVCYGCENGKCLAPNTCECDEGFTRNDKDVKCEPICNGCEGVCIGPHNCICKPPLIARHENVDGQYCNCFVNCTDSKILCERTVCVIGNPDVYEPAVEKKKIDDIHRNVHYNEDYNYDENSYKTESTDKSSYTSPVNYMDLDIMRTKSDLIDNNHTAGNQQIKKLNNGMLNFWLYVGMAALTLIMIIIILTSMFKRRTLSKYYNGGSYIVEDGSKSQNECRPSTSFDMRFSSIEKSAKERD